MQVSEEKGKKMFWDKNHSSGTIKTFYKNEKPLFARGSKCITCFIKDYKKSNLNLSEKKINKSHFNGKNHSSGTI